MQSCKLAMLVLVLISGAILGPVSLAVAEDNFARTTVDLGMVVRDVAQSVAFYTQAVGFKEVPGFKADAQFTTDAGLTDNQPADVHVLVLGDGDTATRLKLMQMPGAEPKSGDSRFIHSQFGFRYLTIGVKDMDAAVARLTKAGVKPLGKCPLALPKSLAPDRYLTVFRDPDGNLVEFVGPKQK
jgi:catechol 2,3-dioxygenase-like lactoylglutathione lyase family enzyme